MTAVINGSVIKASLAGLAGNASRQASAAVYKDFWAPDARKNVAL